MVYKKTYEALNVLPKKSEKKFVKFESHFFNIF